MRDIVERLETHAFVADKTQSGMAPLFEECLEEITRLRAELKLSEDMLRSQAKSIEKLVSRIEYSEEACVRLDASMNRLKAAFRINMLRAFPSMSHEEIDAEIAAAIRESGE